MKIGCFDAHLSSLFENAFNCKQFRFLHVSELVWGAAPKPELQQETPLETNDLHFTKHKCSVDIYLRSMLRQQPEESNYFVMCFKNLTPVDSVL